MQLKTIKNGSSSTELEQYTKQSVFLYFSYFFLLWFSIQKKVNKIFPGLDREKFFLVQTRKNFSTRRTNPLALNLCSKVQVRLTEKSKQNFSCSRPEKFFLVQTGKNFSWSRPGKIFPSLEQEKFCLLFSVWKWAKTCIFSDFFLFWNNEKKF